MDGERHLRNVSALLVVGSVISVLAGVIVNAGMNAQTFDWFEGGGRLALAATVTVVLTVWLGRKYIDRNRVNYADEAAIRRIKATLSNLDDSSVTTKPILSLELSVGPAGDPGNLGLSFSQEASAFVAALTSDPICTVVTGHAGAGKSTLLRCLAVRMAEARERGVTRYTPLLISCRDWTRQSELTSWVTGRCQEMYGIPTDLTRMWFRRGAVLLVLDGADEIVHDAWPSFQAQVNRWLISPVGGRIVVSCRHDAYLSYFRQIRHERVASLQPLSAAAIREYLTRIIEERITDPSEKTEIESLLPNLLLDTPEDRPTLLTPLLIRMVADGMRHYRRGGEDEEAAEDPIARIVKLGDSLSREGNQSAAVSSYMAAVDSRSSKWRSLAVVRASLLLARCGDRDGARQALERSLAAEIEQPLHRTFLSIEEHLSDDEQSVLRTLIEGQILDAFQISSRTLIPPTRCNAALRRLRERGLIDVLGGDGTKDPRFQRSVVELIGH